MPERGLGRALRKALGREVLLPPAEEREGTVSALMNPVRERIFQHLHERPCRHLRGLARDLAMSPPTALWHLNRLREHGFVDAAANGGKTVFMPRGWIAAEDVRTFAVAAEDIPAAALRSLARHTPRTLGRLSASTGRPTYAVARALGKLEALGVVRKRGPQAAYEITATAGALKEKYARRVGPYLQDLVNRLRADGVAPRVVEQRRGLARIEVGSGPSKQVLALPLNPASMLVR